MFLFLVLKKTLRFKYLNMQYCTMDILNVEANTFEISVRFLELPSAMFHNSDICIYCKYVIQDHMLD